MTLEKLKTLQAKIIRRNKKINIISTIIIFFVAGIILSYLISLKNKFRFIYIGMFAEPVVYIIIISYFTKKIVNGDDIDTFNKEFKKIFVLNFLEKQFDDLIYKPETGISKDEINKIGMLDTGDEFSSNDYVSGKYKNINFEQSDIQVEKIREEYVYGKKKEVLETIFKGRWMIFDFNKRFKYNVQVFSFGFQAHSVPRNKKNFRIKMEDIEFNKMFSIYSETEHVAFYILTPHFMEKLKKIYRELNCDIMFSFADNRLYIAINNYEDSFEYNVFKRINEEEIEKNINKDIKLIIDFVNELDLDNNLFRKEV